jgi:hypothetical protein
VDTHYVGLRLRPEAPREVALDGINAAAAEINAAAAEISAGRNDVTQDRLIHLTIRGGTREGAVGAVERALEGTGAAEHWELISPPP